MADSLFYGSSSGSLFYGSGQSNAGPASAGGVNLEAIERTGRRMSLLTTYASDLALTTPEGALALAESAIDDDEMLRSATESTNYANVQRVHQQLQGEKPEVQDALFKSLPKPIADALASMGYTPPDIERSGGGNRWGINLPDILPIDELTISRDTPILGDLGVVQAGAGELLEGARGAGGHALKPFAWAGGLVPHLYRAMKYTQEEEGQNFAETFNVFHNLSPGVLSHAWGATDSDDGYVRPASRERARKILGGDQLLYEVAHGAATGRTPDEIIEAAGYELDSPEALEMSLAILEAQGLPQMEEAIGVLSTGQVSFGRTLTQDTFGLDDTDSGFGRIFSGVIDAGFSIAADPTLGLGRASRSARFGRHAFMLETAGDVDRMRRTAQLAANLERARSGAGAAFRLGNVRPSEMRRAGQVLRWADRVSEGFATGRLAELGRDLPNVMPVLSTMSDAHRARQVEGGADLASSAGVVDWLIGRDGLLAIAGSRLGGSSPMVQGLRMPSLSRAQQATMQAKGAFTRAIDWSRLQYTAAGPDSLGGVLTAAAHAAGDPPALHRQIGQFLLSQTAGNAGRLVAGLTSHAPYSRALRLFGNESVEEFSRLVNLGIFGRMPRSEMDSLIDDFARGDLVARSNITERFLEQLFKAGGVADTDFARRFVGRHRQAYAVDNADLIDVGDVQSHAARLVDAHHADALAIPSYRDYFRATARINTTRFLFNNTPASWADAALGKVWKPAVLMRLGFIPRAAGEELLHYVLKVGSRSYLGAKGAEWVAQDELGNDILAKIEEADALGYTDEVNRLTQRYAETQGFFTAPVRALAGATDRLMVRLFETSAVDPGRFRTRMTSKAHALDERGVVSGLEMWAIERSLWASGLMNDLASAARMPSKAQLGEWMANRWNPDAIEAARLLISDDRAQRAFVEQVAGSTYVPWEFSGTTDANGAPIPKVLWEDKSGALPVMSEVPMRPTGAYATQAVVDTGGDVTSFFHSIFSRQMRLRKDRVGNAVLNDTLPRWVGSFGEDLTSRLGVEDLGTFREELNQLWSWAGTDELNGRSLLGAVRKLIDEGDETGEGLRVWLGKGIDEAAEDLGLTIDGRTLSGLIADPQLSQAARHWLAYEKVDGARLIDRWADLERQLGHRAKGRLSRPDMQRKLREMRLYADEKLAVPVQHHISKIYVPMVRELPDALPPAFVEAAVRNIRYIGGYGEERARLIAQHVADSVASAREVATEMSGLVPLSGWGAADPRVADAVMAAADEALGTRSVHGILEVPDDVIQQSVGDGALGVRAPWSSWQTADDYLVDAYRLLRTRATPEHRRLVSLGIGDEAWDEVDLRIATSAFGSAPLPGKVRLFQAGDEPWVRAAPDGPFRFVDVDDAVASRYADQIPDDLADQLGSKRLPGVPPDDGRWAIEGVELSEGLGEIEALERVASSSMDEVMDVLTTLNRTELDDDVLHEIVEPMLRPDKVSLDEAGNKVIEMGYGFDHLVGGVNWDRLPKETYGPVLAAAPDFRWNKIVSSWFEGPVDKAISSIIRKPMFLDNFGQQLRNQKALVDLFIEPEIAAAVKASGLDDTELDALALNFPEDGGLDEIEALVEEISPGLTLGDNEALALQRYARQRGHGLSMVRQSAMERAIQLTTPYIDDHRVRSSFQNYVGNFVPFHFAEEQFLKRWTRSVVESPEMVRRAQLGMNGIRSMGVVRKDERGNEVFVYPAAGEAVAILSAGAANLFGERLRVPYVGAMTGEVGYTLPGLGDRFGVPSVGPLVTMPLELLSRHFPELADLEQQVSGPGADRPVWSYFVPSWAGRTWEGVFGQIDKTQLASATNQAIQMMALNGQMPPENATAHEQQEFIERAQGQARVIVMARGLLGMAAPAAPQFRTKADDLNAEFVELLRLSQSPDEAVAAFLAKHPDVEPADLLATTVFTSESEYAGLPTPTRETFDWVRSNEDVVDGFPAAAPWLLPRGNADDEFSYRAWAQQMAKGLRTRKSPEELVDDVRFAGAARDYFNAKTLHDADMLVSTGAERAQYASEWNAWKASYFRQHPVFARMLQDPTRGQRRAQAMEQLEVLAADEEGPVPPELREMVQAYRDYQHAIAGLRGGRSQGVSRAREGVTQEFAAWSEWQVQRYPWLAGFYMRVVRPDLQGLDDDAVTSQAA
jgi:hypothetical protein